MKDFKRLESFNAAFNLSFSNGTMVLLEYSCLARLAMETNMVEIIGGNQNSLRASGNNELIFYNEESSIQKWFFYEEGTKAWGHYQEDQHFINCIIKDEEPNIKAEDARRSQEIALAILNSNETGKPIKIM